MRVAQYIKRKFSPYDRWRRVALTAQRKGDWVRAAAALRQAESVRPSPALSVQLGHALKESGDADAAAIAYRRAAAHLPRDLDVREHLAFLLRNAGQVEAAAEVYAEMLTIEPRCFQAQRALAELGQRCLLPVVAMGRHLIGERVDRLGSAMADFRRAWSDGLITSAFSPSHYDIFRLAYPTPPPPARSSDESSAVVLVLCRNAMAADIRATVDSIACSSTGSARILLLLDPEQHVAERVMAVPCAVGIERFSSWRAILGTLDPSCPLVVTRAGTVLNPHAMAWLAFAAQRNSADAIYGDHDFRIDSVPYGGWLTAPCFFGAHDNTTIASMPGTPLLVRIRAEAVAESLSGMDERASINDVLRSIVTARRRVTHVPRVLATFNCRSLPSLAVLESGLSSERSKPTIVTVPEPVPLVSGHRHASITIIIPTRDQAEMLERCVTSLIRSAAQLGRVRFVIVDNRSTKAETRDLLRRLRKDGIDVVGHDRPFNWSTINNVVAATSRDDILLFANNDVESLIEGWDVLVEEALARSEVGAVGARLVYPDGSYQHAGVTFGIAEGALSAHEGVGFDGSAAGPGGRWIVRRAAAAVTGAFLATRRSTFEQVGGFDDRLAIAYNDLDFCFRIRAAGLQVVYEPSLSLLHHESKTRGYNVSADDVEWDLREQSVFLDTWGQATGWDPGYNPQWALGGTPFDGYREPSLAEILQHIDCQAHGKPWLVVPRSSHRSTSPRR